MATRRFVEGEHLYFTEDLPGICPVKAGDEMVYLGNSQARIVTGQSKGWLVTLTIMAPVEPRQEAVR